MPGNKWYERSYRRNLVDMHIDDWDETFLSQLDANVYLALLRKAHVQSAMVYANSHVGLCYWPTASGKMHAGLKGKDFFDAMVEGCHRQGMDVIAYYSLIFNNCAHEDHPSWRMLDEDSSHSRERGRDLFRLTGRYGLLCPNNEEYRAFVDEQVREICTGYPVEGIFFDMVFWPMVCYCPACRGRFEREVSGEMPVVVDWQDSRWFAFQRKREEWMVEFAAFANALAKKYRPGISVELNSAPLTQPWKIGETLPLREQNDYIGGDLYGGFGEQSFICKFYQGITLHRPFEYMTSRCDPSLLDHTTLKSQTSLALHAFLALAHGGAFLFIDAIDPIGTLNATVFERMGEVFAETSRYEPYLGGELCSNVAVYLSLGAKYVPSDGGKPADLVGRGYPHLTAAQGAARALREAHVPFSVIGENGLDDLPPGSALIVGDIAALSEGESAKIKRFVEAGGGLYASGRGAAETLGELFGVTLKDETQERVTYMKPNAKGQSLFGDLGTPYLSVWSTQVRAMASDPQDVVASLSLPYTLPWQEAKFASIHSNPPGIDTEYASIVLRSYGKGKVAWSAAPLENETREPHRKALLGLVRALCDPPFLFEADAPPAIEVIAFHQPEKKRYVLNLINEQELLPPVATQNLTLRLRLADKRPLRAVLAPDERSLPIETTGEYVQIIVPEVQLFAMVLLDYE